MAVRHFWMFQSSGIRAFSTSSSALARGIRGAIKGLNLKEHELEDLSVDDLETMTSFSMEDVSQQASQIERDADDYQRHIKRKIVERKYFKDSGPQEPNLLTWAMKEQLRYLHSTDPDTWTPETLATAFPISTSGVNKLLRVRWVPESNAAIEQHDRNVLERWKKVTNGRLGSAQLLKKALENKFGPGNTSVPQPAIDSDEVMSTMESLRFEHEEQPHEPRSVKPKNKLPKNKKMKGGTFSSIIKDYNNQVNKENNPDQVNKGNSTDQRVSPEPLPRGTNISEITSSMPMYQGNYSPVMSKGAAGARINRSRRNSSGGTLMTFSEFMNRKKLGTES